MPNVLAGLNFSTEFIDEREHAPLCRAFPHIMRSYDLYKRVATRHTVTMTTHHASLVVNTARVAAY